MEPKTEIYNPTNFPIKLRTATLFRTLHVDQEKRSTVPIISSFIPFVQMGTTLDANLTEIASLTELQKILAEKEFRPADCKQITIKYFDRPANVTIKQASTANLKAFYGEN